ncbi:MAG: hypothetical protein Q8O22_06330 [Candidatus Omnitrophota bacterium]|nr:hypothetical protein [Candidatus Omnitrophota bacterium]
MQWFKVNLVGYLICISLDSIVFVADVLLGQGGSGRISEKFGLGVIILISTLVFVGTTGYLFRIIPKINRIVLVVLSILASFLQIIILIGISFFFNMYILAPILGRLGFYITMP